MINRFHEVSNVCSKICTEKYSTSFSSAIKLLHKDLHTPIYNIYGFVRFADEIVDSFHDFNKPILLQEFYEQTMQAIERKISTNPILNSFQFTVNKYGISFELIESFFNSMESDLCNTSYNADGIKDYIFGSAEVVGLMCLSVFCEGDTKNYEILKPYAKSLGAAFQKVNFLRDIKEDKQILNRDYFPGVNAVNFGSYKIKIEADIARDFQQAFTGIKMLPGKARLGVYVAYKYYQNLFKKIQKAKPSFILNSRIRVPNYSKLYILFTAGLRSQLRLF